jgi:endonuclease/exonuclease/phosphatase family metal-dependent hydrolase
LFLFLPLFGYHAGVRLASYNVENLFQRAKALNVGNWDDTRAILEKFNLLTDLLGAVTYTDEARAEMTGLMVDLGLEKEDIGPFVLLRRNRGRLVKRPASGGIEIIAEGRADWVGSMELRREPVNQFAMQNTARVIRDLGADVLAVVEVESRPVLVAYDQQVLPAVGGTPHASVMVIDGNDERGIDVGLLLKPGNRILAMRSHVDVRGADGELLFDRDCAEYWVETAAGNPLILLLNHLKSKGSGGFAASSRRRRAQATRVRDIYRERRAEGHGLVAVLGDLNDTPGSRALAPLMDDTDLADISTHPAFDDGGRPGTLGSSTASSKIDYVLLSPDLFARATGGGIFRRGMWPGVRPRKWDAYPEITRPVEAASDHGAIFADIDV